MYDETARSWMAISSYIPSARKTRSTLGIKTRTADGAFLTGKGPHPAPSRRPATLGQAGRRLGLLVDEELAAPVAARATEAARSCPGPLLPDVPPGLRRRPGDHGLLVDVRLSFTRVAAALSNFDSALADQGSKRQSTAVLEHCCQILTASLAARRPGPARGGLP